MRSSLKWAGHVERTGDKKLANRSNAQKVKGKGKRAKPKMRWEDCVERYLERVGGEWRATATD